MHTNTEKLFDMMLGGLARTGDVLVGAPRLPLPSDIVAAAAVSGAPWSTSGRKAIVPKADTPESTSIKTDDDEITVTVGTAALTGGKLTGYLYYVVGEEDA